MLARMGLQSREGICEFWPISYNCPHVGLPGMYRTAVTVEGVPGNPPFLQISQNAPTSSFCKCRKNPVSSFAGPSADFTARIQPNARKPMRKVPMRKVLRCSNGMVLVLCSRVEKNDFISLLRADAIHKTCLAFTHIKVYPAQSFRLDDCAGYTFMQPEKVNILLLRRIIFQFPFCT
jgi:hypothetical protein